MVRKFKFYRYVACSVVISIIGFYTNSMEAWPASLVVLSMAIGNWND